MTAELTVKNTHIFYPKLVKVYADLARKSIRLLTRPIRIHLQNEIPAVIDPI